MNTRVYRWLVRLYPQDLRRDYGEEMVLVFGDELRDADFRGAVRAWRRAIAEFFRLALPAWLSTAEVRVPAITLALLLGYVGGMISVDALRQGRDAVTYFHTLQDAVLLPLFFTPYISLLAVWACRGRKPISLDLNEKGPASCSNCAI
ncbi:MAG TPA: hypothetical protein VMB03_25260 [Bryobacteraceae bacterium]|nr:hypothetical protein [Bryobacteraceae bacterium]